MLLSSDCSSLSGEAMAASMPRLDIGVDALAGEEPATRGVRGVVFIVRIPEALKVGARVLWFFGLVLSRGIAFPVEEVNGEPDEMRIIAF